MRGKFFLTGDFLPRHILVTREWTQYSTIDVTMVKKTGNGKEESARCNGGGLSGAVS